MESRFGKSEGIIGIGHDVAPEFLVYGRAGAYDPYRIPKTRSNNFTIELQPEFQRIMKCIGFIFSILNSSSCARLIHESQSKKWIAATP